MHEHQLQCKGYLSVLYLYQLSLSEDGRATFSL